MLVCVLYETKVGKLVDRKYEQTLHKMSYTPVLDVNYNVDGIALLSSALSNRKL
jgi:hypothetical protein